MRWPAPKKQASGGKHFHSSGSREETTSDPLSSHGSGHASGGGTSHPFLGLESLREALVLLAEAEEVPNLLGRPCWRPEDGRAFAVSAAAPVAHRLLRTATTSSSLVSDSLCLLLSSPERDPPHSNTLGEEGFHSRQRTPSETSVLSGGNFGFITAS